MNDKKWLKISCPRNYEKSDERKQIDAESNKGQPRNQKIREFRYKTEMPMEAEDPYLKQFYEIKLYFH